MTRISAEMQDSSFPYEPGGDAEHGRSDVRHVQKHERNAGGRAERSGGNAAQRSLSYF